MWNKQTLIGIGQYLALVATIIIVGYGCFWMAKTGSYKFWYESKVKETVREMFTNGEIKMESVQNEDGSFHMRLTVRRND